MRKSLLLFVVNLALILALAQFDDKTTIDSNEDGKEIVENNIEDGVSNHERAVVNK